MLPLAVIVPAIVRALLAVTRALAVMGAELEKDVEALKEAAAFAVNTPFAVSVAAGMKVVGALTVTLLLVSVPRVTLPRALKLLPAVMVRAAFAVMGAVNVLAALTVSEFVPEVPICVLPAVLRVLSSVLPVTVRVPVGLGRVRLPDMVARPLLSMVRRSTSWLLPVLVLASCILHSSTIVWPVVPICQHLHESHHLDTRFNNFVYAV